VVIVLRILGSNRVGCGGLSRRDFLHAGALAPFGLTLADWAANTSVQAASPLPGFGKAKRCLLLYLWGSPSQLETFDPKPDAPVEVRGELSSIPTAVPGVRIGEIFPRIAKLLDRVTIVRSLTHPYPVHGVSFATSAVPITDIPLETNPRDSRHWPFMGSVVDYLAEQHAQESPVIPRNFGLPFPFGSKRGPARSGPFGGFLGPAYDTVWSEFRAKGIREVRRDSGSPNAPTPMVADPYIGIRPGDRFESSSTVAEITLDRLNERATLLEQFDQARRATDRRMSQTTFDHHRALAISVLTSSTLRDALDVQRETEEVRERYGMNLFGQSCLAARRILEAGGQFVTVCWDEYGLFNTGWDTHVHHYPRLKEELGPGLDNGFCSLLEDLDARGMLEDTAIVVLSEHGRTPNLQNVDGGGRDHWSRVYSAMFAGGGFAEGNVVGRSDRIGGEVAENPFSPKDVVATVFHLLGIDPQREIHDREGRPHLIGGNGRVRSELLA
jgi:hypothetical protein